MKRRIMPRTTSNPELHRAYMAICEKALNRMPTEFTSDGFGKLIRQFGVPDSFVDADKMSQFLHQNCNKIGETSSRRWKKIIRKDIKQESAIFEFEDIVDVKNKNITIDQALQVLKDSGMYKIMRRKEEWEEI